MLASDLCRPAVERSSGRQAREGDVVGGLFRIVGGDGADVGSFLVRHCGRCVKEYKKSNKLE